MRESVYQPPLIQCFDSASKVAPAQVHGLFWKPLKAKKERLISPGLEPGTLSAPLSTPQIFEEWLVLDSRDTGDGSAKSLVLDCSSRGPYTSYTTKPFPTHLFPNREEW